jgi:hypothetical protein
MLNHKQKSLYIPAAPGLPLCSRTIEPKVRWFDVYLAVKFLKSKTADPDGQAVDIAVSTI